MPKYSWYFGYGQNNYLLISEENNQIYTFSEDYLNNLDFIKDKKINDITNKENKTIDILESSINSCTFLSNHRNEIFCIDNRNFNNEKLYQKENNEYPFEIEIEEISPKIKIKSISASYKSIYIIDINGNLYENNEYFKSTISNIQNEMNDNDDDNTKWKKINLPHETNKFLQCACGDGHLLCLIEDNEGKGKIYAKGENSNYQCGVYQSTGYSNNISGRFIEVLTQCTNTAHLNFKSIYANKDFSAAITVDNKLYIWGLLDKNNYRRL